MRPRRWRNRQSEHRAPAGCRAKSPAIQVSRALKISLIVSTIIFAAALSRPLKTAAAQEASAPRPGPALPVEKAKDAPPATPQKTIPAPTLAPLLSAEESRQARLVADTAKLFQLAQELKVEVDKSTKDTMSMTVVKKAAEVERLAHDLKERMKAEPPKTR